MANKYNIVVGVKIDQNSNISQQIQNAISKTTFKINLDLTHLRTQLQSVFDGLKVNVGGGVGGGGAGATASGGAKEKVAGIADPASLITRNQSVKTYYDEVNQEIRELRTGYDELGRSVSEVNRLKKEGEEITRERISSTVEEGNLINKNVQTYENLSARLEHLHKNGQINNKQYAEFKQRLQQLNPELSKTNKTIDQLAQNRGLKQLGQDISDAGKHAMTFGDMMKTAFEKFMIWSVVTVAWYAMVRAMKDVVKQAVEIDKAFTRIQMVTLKTDAEINKLKGDYMDLAREMKVSLTTVTDAAEAWLRTGMSATDATEALQASIVLSKDAFMDSATATQYLVAAQKAYKLEAEDLMGVVDKLTVLDSKAATTAADLGESLSMSASSAGLAGISMDKYLAILATTSETTQQSASTIGNAWKTILARLQQVKLGKAMDEEGEDISNVDTLLKEYGIDLMETTDNLSNMEALIDELGKRWQGYTAAQKSEIATIVAGTRQRDKLIATLNNYDRVVQLTNESMESAGQAAKKYAVYADSVEAKIQDLKTAWTELADATVKSDFIKFIVEATTKLADFQKEAGGIMPLLGYLLAIKIGGIPGLIIAIGSAIVSMFSYVKNQGIKVLEENKKKIEENINAYNEERKTVAGLMAEYLSLSTVMDKTSEETERLTELTRELRKEFGFSYGSITDVSTALNAYFDTTLKDYAKQIKELQEGKASVAEEIKNAEIEAIKDMLTFGPLPVEQYFPRLAKIWEYTNYPVRELAGGLAGLFDTWESLSVTTQAVSEYEDKINALQQAYELAEDASTKFKSAITDIGQFEKSEVGANKLLKGINEMKDVIESITNTVGYKTNEEMQALAENLTEIYKAYLQIYTTFTTTDFVLTEYYDKQLKALQEQKKLEDELAEQQEKKKKITEAELKKQEALLEVEKARAALEEAREKRIAVFRMGKGFVYEEDTQSIAEAQSNLDSALEGYQKALEDFAKVQETATERLISAVEKLQQAYGLALLGDEEGKARKFFQTPENLEWYKGLTQDEQLATLMQFMTPENQAKAQALWGLNPQVVEAVGEQVRGRVFGASTLQEENKVEDYLGGTGNIIETDDSGGGVDYDYQEYVEDIAQAIQFLEEEGGLKPRNITSYSDLEAFIQEASSSKNTGVSLGASLLKASLLEGGFYDLPSEEQLRILDIINQKAHPNGVENLESSTNVSPTAPVPTTGRWYSWSDASNAGYSNIAGASRSEMARVKGWKNPYTGQNYQNYQEYLDAMYLQYVEKRPTEYHSGGIVGEPAFNSDTEMYAKLLKGEIVLPQNKFNSIIDRVQSATTNNSRVLNIGNISLPNVTDTDSFISELQKISYAKAE